MANGFAADRIFLENPERDAQEQNRWYEVEALANEGPQRSRSRSPFPPGLHRGLAFGRQNPEELLIFLVAYLPNETVVIVMQERGREAQSKDHTLEPLRAHLNAMADVLPTGQNGRRERQETTVQEDRKNKLRFRQCPIIGILLS